MPKLERPSHLPVFPFELYGHTLPQQRAWLLQPGGATSELLHAYRIICLRARQPLATKALPSAISFRWSVWPQRDIFRGGRCTKRRALHFCMLATLAFNDKLRPQLRALEDHCLEVTAQLLQLVISRTVDRVLLLDRSSGCPDMLVGAGAVEWVISTRSWSRDPFEQRCLER